MKKILMALVFSVLVLTLVSNISAVSYSEIRECKLDCRADYSDARDVCTDEYGNCASECGSDRSCKTSCLIERNDCRREASSEYRSCSSDCSKDPECLLGNHEVGEKFPMGCEECSCNSRGKLRCKTDNFCNRDVEIEQDFCEDNGGFFSRLCKGPYFGVVCSQASFCMCGGINEYTCAENYDCLTDFIAPIRTNYKISGFRDLLGMELGDIGLCAAPLETPMIGNSTGNQTN